MLLEKGNIVKNIHRNDRPEFADTVANSELTYRVIRVNPKTYGLECIGGYMQGTRCNLRKDFEEKSVDVYGTTSEWVLVAGQPRKPVKSPANKVVEILIRRDGLTKREAEARLAECRRLCNKYLEAGDYEGVEDTIAAELGLEMDYIFDILD